MPFRLKREKTALPKLLHMSHNHQHRLIILNLKIGTDPTVSQPVINASLFQRKIYGKNSVSSAVLGALFYVVVISYEKLFLRLRRQWNWN